MIELESQEFINATLPIFSDRKVNYFIDASCGPQKFIRKMIYFTEKLLDIDFRLVKQEIDAEIWFCESPLIDNDPQLLGRANHLPDENRWKIDIKKGTNYLKKFVYLHEFGHVLGLEHPQDNSDGDIWEGRQNTDDTIMSYNLKGYGRKWWFRNADIDTITGIWRTL